MIEFDNTIKERKLINGCLGYLPNPNNWIGSVYKVNFIVKPSIVLHNEADTDVDTKVYTAFFRIGYNDTGGKIWEFDRFDSPLR